MTPTELSQYYQSLLILQYTNSLKAKATIDAYVSPVIANNIIASVRDAFNVDTAIGVQLDVLGAYRGLTRFIFGLSLTKSFFCTPVYTFVFPPTQGLATYGQSNTDIVGFFIRYQDINAVSYRMNDPEFRQVIKFRALVHSTFLSLANIDSILFQFFKAYVTLTDNGNMTITYTNSPSNPDQLYTLVKQSNSLPKPAGVQIV